MTGRRFLVTGRVQGVGYRWFVLQHAMRLELRGYARNCGDGSVEVVACGSSAALAELEQQLRTGPALAKVTAVHASDTAEDLDVTGFEIQRS